MRPAVLVARGPSGDRAATHDAALDLLARASGAPRKVLVWRQICHQCGGSDHGAPVTSLAGWWLSVSHADAFDLIAVSSAGPLGVDHEPVGRISAPECRQVAAAPGELPADATAEQATRLWVRKEAVLKATGAGLAIAPDRVWVGVTTASRVDGVIAGTGVRVRRLIDLDVGPSHTAALAVVERP